MSFVLDVVYQSLVYRVVIISVEPFIQVIPVIMVVVPVVLVVVSVVLAVVPTVVSIGGVLTLAHSHCQDSESTN